MAGGGLMSSSTKKPSPAPLPSAELGQVAYEAYRDAVDGTSRGPRPTWDERVAATPAVADAWRVAALAVVAASQED